MTALSLENITKVNIKPATITIIGGKGFMTKQNNQKDHDKYFLTYHYDSTLVIADNDLKENGKF